LNAFQGKNPTWLNGIQAKTQGKKPHLAEWSSPQTQLPTESPS